MKFGVKLVLSVLRGDDEGDNPITSFESHARRRLADDKSLSAIAVQESEG